MENRRKFLTTSLNSAGKRQTDLETGLAQADFDKRIKATVEVEDVLTTDQVRDCSDVDLVDETVETKLKQANWNLPQVTAHWLAWILAFVLGAAGNPTDDVPSGRKKHPLTRSSSDDLPAFSFVDCFEDVLATAEKYIGHKIQSVTINIVFRQSVTVSFQTVGRFGTENIVNFDLPDCEIVRGLKSWNCKNIVDGVDRSDVLYGMTITISNNMPISPEDNFGNVGDDVQTLERGDQPSYSIAPQYLIKKGHPLHTLAKNRAKVPFVVQFGDDAEEHVVLTFPNTQLVLNSRWRQFVGELGKPSTLIDATPMKDAALGSPLKADAYLDQASAFLLT